MTTDKKIAAQRAEFDAADSLAFHLRRLNMTAVVDDDYQAVRGDYEAALAAFMQAVEINRGKVPPPDAREVPEFLTALRAANLSRVVRFGHGDIKAPHGWGPMQWGCALAGEVGELCNYLKKYQRQMPSDPSPDELHGEIAREIADVFIYLDLLAATFDLDLGRIIASKFNATSKKFGFPERL